MSDYLVQFNNISKFFGKVIALKDVTMKLKKGEIMCLLGDNGAGKSTLIKTLAGVHRPDEGEIIVEGKRTIFATIQVLDAGSADTMRGTLKELEAIAAAVVGGCLLTGGYGSAIGAAFGALIFGTVSMGIFYTDVDTDWFKVFLGAMMLIAVIFNNYIRRKVTESK